MIRTSIYILNFFVVQEKEPFRNQLSTGDGQGFDEYHGLYV